MEEANSPAKQVGEENERQETTAGRKGAEEASVDDYERQLTEVEDQIDSTGKKLRDLYFQSLRANKDDVEKRKQLEDERTTLRKQLIEASYNHKQLIENKEEQFRRQLQHEREEHQREREEEEKKLEAERQQRRQAREEEIKKIEAERQERRHAREEQGRKLESSRKSEKGTIHESHIVIDDNQEGGNQPQKKEAAEEKKEEKEEQPPVRSAEEALSESRYRLRVAEIQNQLALESLRRSRRTILDIELAALRSRYSYYPYYPSYSLYPYLPSYRYPLYARYGYYGYLY